MKGQKIKLKTTTQCKPDQSFETAAYLMGFRAVCGVDESGRGPLAGPVVAAAVVFPTGCVVKGVNDSKKLTPSNREIFKERIIAKCLDYGIGVVDVDDIEQLNILGASLEAMRRAVCSLKHIQPDLLLIDGIHRIHMKIPQSAIRRGDAVCHSIAAASILAKCHRDDLMREYHTSYPEYGFNRHKGYCTRRHLEMIRRCGILPIHRKSFAPVRDFINLSE
ncbi:MAG: ribonuclease HII [bacterium]